MYFFEAKRMIKATPSQVWSILEDAPTLVSGELGITRIDGAIGPGKQITVWSEAAPGRAFKLRVSEWKPPSRMTWVGGIPLELFRGTRRFDIREVDRGVEFTVREDYSGPLTRLIWKSMPDLNPSFAKFADGLKRLAEERNS